MALSNIAVTDSPGAEEPTLGAYFACILVVIARILPLKCAIAQIQQKGYLSILARQLTPSALRGD